jgi:hypothetical protein
VLLKNGFMHVYYNLFNLNCLKKQNININLCLSTQPDIDTEQHKRCFITMIITCGTDISLFQLKMADLPFYIISRNVLCRTTV